MPKMKKLDSLSGKIGIQYILYPKRPKQARLLLVYYVVNAMV